MEMEKHEVRTLVSSLLDMYCEDCFLYQCHSEEKGRRKAHKFCIKNCTIGKKLQSYGKRLT
jgi:hypothetical protein